MSVLFWVTGLLFAALACSVYVVLSLLVPPPRLYLLARAGCRFILLMAGQVLRVRGTFPAKEEGPFIYVFNHASILDTFAVIGAIPRFTGAVGKKEQFELPVWGWILRRWGVVPIDRSDRATAIQSLDKVQHAVRGGLSLLIAPEGTRSPDGRLGTLRKGAFHIATNTGAAIVPLAIHGAFRAKNKGSWLLRPGGICVEVLPSISPRRDSVSDVESLREETRSCLEEELSSQS
jgi:1-acyl-sn-glycerol-3-phosphate acyltransferase